MEFHDSKHAAYISKVASDKVSFEYVVTQHFRMSGVYWGLTAMSLLGRDIHTEMKTEEITEWVLSCRHSCGGFSGDVGHDPHVLYTLSAIQILALCGKLDTIDRDLTASFIKSLQQPDGCFWGDIWGEVDTRFSYCALSSLAILDRLTPQYVDLPNAVRFIYRCRNFDGGFGAVPDGESHAAQVFCCIGALSIANALLEVPGDPASGTSVADCKATTDVDLLGWWLAERQCDSGGLNGRPEKQADVCYSWWILSCLTILGRTSWINKDKLTKFILNCQDSDDGGIAERPGNMADIFHTFFGIGGLSLLSYFDRPAASFDSPAASASLVVPPQDVEGEGSSKVPPPVPTVNSTEFLYAHYNAIDPTYALPRNLVKSLNLPAQILPPV